MASRMLMILAVIFLGLSSQVFARQLVKIKPGTSIDISPNIDTTVLCEADASVPATVSKYCKCVWGEAKGQETLIKKVYALYSVIILNDGKKVEDLVVNFETDKKACEDATKTHPACR